MTRNQYIILFVLLLGSFAAGRFLTPAKIVTETKTVEVEKIVHDKVIDENVKTVTVKTPDGTSTTTTTIDKHTSDHSTTDDTKNTDSKKIVENSTDFISITALAGININNPTKLEFGAQINRRLIGPLEMGIWGLQTGTVGISLGLRF